MKTRDDISKLLRDLNQLRANYGFRADTLVPDLALIGLVDDVIDAVESGLQLLDTPKPHRAYAMARVAFEAAQRVLVLGTSDQFVTVGTRAWLYYQQKDQALRQGDEAGNDTTEERVLRLWSTFRSDVTAIAAAEREALKNQRKQRRPDNFVGRDLAEAAADAYEAIGRMRGVPAPPSSIAANRAVYRVLSRETHACLRLEPRGVRIDADRFVQVDELERPREIIEEAVLTSLYSSLGETGGALHFRFVTRQLAHAERLQSEAAAVPARPLPDDYVPDLGMYLLQRGIGTMSLVFPAVPLAHFRELEDQTLSTTIREGTPPDEHAVTFDFKERVRAELLNIVETDYADLMKSAAANGFPMRIDLPEPIQLTLTTTLGNLKHNEQEAFIPLIVIEMSRARMPA